MSRSRFTHCICTKCWRAAFQGIEPVRLNDPVIERCCLCGSVTGAGIYIRLDPKQAPYCGCPE